MKKKNDTWVLVCLLAICLVSTLLRVLLLILVPGFEESESSFSSVSYFVSSLTLILACVVVLLGWLER